MATNKKTPDTGLRGTEGLTLGDFWSWAYSDILSNTNRAVFAEFLVGSALGVLDAARVEWDAVDLRYRGHGIEVKSSAYVQSWAQRKPSTITFDVARKRGWDAKTNTYVPESVRSANVYVFCLYPETDRFRADILDIPEWLFYVLPLRVLEERLGNQKQLGLARLRSLGVEPVRYDRLKARVDDALSLEDMQRSAQATTQWPRPHCLEAAIGGYPGPFYYIEWSCGALRYAARPDLDSPVTETALLPTDDQWASFWETMDSLEAWSWRRGYHYHVCDGTHWTFRASVGDRSIDSSGSNGYPPDGDGPDCTPEFIAFCEAIEQLVGGREFR